MDDDAVQDDAAVADEAAVLHRAALEVHEVADRAPVPHHRPVLRRGVHDRAVLDGGPLPHHDPPTVAPQPSERPVALPLARYQARGSAFVTNANVEKIALTPPLRALLGLLDDPLAFAPAGGPLARLARRFRSLHLTRSPFVFDGLTHYVLQNGVGPLLVQASRCIAQGTPLLAEARLAHALGPTMIAIAANSPLLAGQFTGVASGTGARVKRVR